MQSAAVCSPWPVSYINVSSFQTLFDFLHRFPDLQWKLKMASVKDRLKRLLCMSILSKLTQSLLILRTCHALMSASQIAPTIFHWRYAPPAVFPLFNFGQVLYTTSVLFFLYISIWQFLFVFLQFCNLVSLQRYTKALSVRQRALLVEKSRQKPLERIKALNDVSLVFIFIYFGW